MLSRSVFYSAAQRVTLGLFIGRPGEIYFYLQIGIFFGNFGKKEDILDWEWGLIPDPGGREKRPCTRVKHFVLGLVLVLIGQYQQTTLLDKNLIDPYPASNFCP